MFRSNGCRSVTLAERILLRLVALIRRLLVITVRLDDRGHKVLYLCETGMDAWRPISLWIKEEGTMAWIEAEVGTEDVFMDIGANIGIYTIAAAVRVGERGAVYAFEPHKVNALTLMGNVRANGLGSKVTVFSCALSDREGVLAFHYASLESASTASQLGHRRIPGSDREFDPVASEMVFSTSVDALLTQGMIRAPHLIKIDVDGNEIAILRGMSGLLRGASRPRAVQVELNVGEQDQITDFMRQCGYDIAYRHFTQAGKLARSKGAPIEDIAHNAVFRPSAG